MIPKIFHLSKKLAVETYYEVINHNIPLHSAAIAFYTIFSAAPIMFLTLTSSKLILGNTQAIQALTKNLNKITGTDIAQPLIDMAKVASHHHSSLIAAIIGWVVLIFAASTVVSQLQSSLNTIWGVEYPKINSVLLYVINRIISLSIVFVLLSLMISSVLIVSKLGYLHSIFPHHLPAFLGDLSHLAAVFLSIILSILFFTLIFKLLPDVHARWRDIAVGACVTTVLFLLGKLLVTLYLDNSTMRLTYKAAGSFIVFLIWIYYNSLIVLVGAEFTETYTKVHGKGIEKSLNSELVKWRSYF
jgi:membrane protein